MLSALRIGYNSYFEDKRFEEHIKYIKNNIEVIDEITLFVEFSHHGFWSEEFTKNSVEVIKKRIPEYKKAGVKRVGINFLSTIGHLDEATDFLPASPFTHQVSSDGRISYSCNCPGNKEFVEYVKNRYQLYANTGADFIWSDDDFRPSFHGIDGYCFCDGCIDKYNKTHCTNYTREQMDILIKSDKDFQFSYCEFTNFLYNNLLTEITKAVKSVNPSVKIGIMPISTSDVKSAVTCSDADKIRPGGGFYNDSEPYELIKKITNVQEQINDIPKRIRDVQYEYEAFNYQTLEKSMQISKLEIALALASGCNGILFNNDLFCDRQDIIDLLKTNKKQWDIFTYINDGYRPYGVYSPCGNYYIQFGKQRTAKILNELSIPTTPDFDNAVCSVILGDRWDYFDDSEIEKIFTKGVYTDGIGLEILTKRGFSEKLGGKIKATYKNGMAERFGDSLINGNYKGFYRDVFMSFPGYNDKEAAYEFEIPENAESISKLEVITHEKKGCSMFKYENADKTRIIVHGYFMPKSAKSAPKREQFINSLNYISKGKLPVEIQKCIKVAPFVTTNGNGGMNIVLANISFDDTKSFTCRINGDEVFYLLSGNGEFIKLNQNKQNEYVTIEIENIKPWDYVILTNRKK